MAEEIQLNINNFLESFLFPYLRIRSISADKTMKPEIEKAYRFLEDELESSFFDVTGHQMHEGNMILYAEKLVDSSLPTIVIYGHYDVQPITQPDKWLTNNPFEPEIKELKEIGIDVDGKAIVARGADDNKGQFSAYVLAFRYFAEHGWPVNIKVVLEGDEESHGQAVHQFVKEQKDMLACDAVLLSDTSTLVPLQPSFTTDMKGYLFTRATTATIEQLVEMLHKSHDPKSNRVLVSGFYEGIVEQSVSDEVKKILSVTDEKLGTITDMGSFVKPEQGFTPLDHRWYRPAFSPLLFNYANQNPRSEDGNKSIRIKVDGPLRSIHSGQYGGPIQDPALNLAHLLTYMKQKGLKYTIDYIDYGSKIMSTSILPQASAQITFQDDDSVNLNLLLDEIFTYSALEQNLFTFEKEDERVAYLKRFDQGSYVPTAVLSFRLVHGQDGRTIYNEICRQDGNFELLGIADPFYVETDSPYFVAAAEGFKRGFGTDSVVNVGEGGSIPVTSTFKDELGVPVILAGLGHPNGNLHGPNENFLLEHLKNGAKSIIYAIQNMGTLKNR